MLTSQTVFFFLLLFELIFFPRRFLFLQDNVAVINAVDKTEILEKAEIKQIWQTQKTGASSDEPVEVKVTIAQLPTTQAIDSMIMNGQVSVKTPIKSLEKKYSVVPRKT